MCLTRDVEFSVQTHQKFKKITKKIVLFLIRLFHKSNFYALNLKII